MHVFADAGASGVAGVPVVANAPAAAGALAVAASVTVQRGLIYTEHKPSGLSGYLKQGGGTLNTMSSAVKTPTQVKVRTSTLV